jgi:hypothetical protein
MTTQWVWYTLRLYERGYLNASFINPEGDSRPHQWIDDAVDSYRFSNLAEAEKALSGHPLGPLVRIVRVVIRVEDV